MRARWRSYVSSCDRAVHVSPQMWEKAIELGKQLAKMHEIHMFDFMELSQLLVRGRRHCRRS